MTFLESSICVKRGLSWNNLKQGRLGHISFTNKNALADVINDEGFLFICFLPWLKNFQ